MATYCWECPDCGSTKETKVIERPECDVCWDMHPCGGPFDIMRRDYKAEAVFIKAVPGGYKASGKSKDKESQSDGTDAE